MKHVAFIASVLLALWMMIPAAGAQPVDPNEDPGEGELTRDYQDIEKMLREDDPDAPVDYGYGPGVLPPSMQSKPANVPARQNDLGAGAGR